MAGQLQARLYRAKNAPKKSPAILFIFSTKHVGINNHDKVKVPTWRYLLGLPLLHAPVPACLRNPARACLPAPWPADFLPPFAPPCFLSLRS